MLRHASLLAVVVVVLTVVGVAGLSAQEHDNAIFHYSMLDADAARSNDFVVGRWDAAGWVGTDFDRLWWSTAGEGLDRELESAEATVLYGRYVRRFWDLVVGYRHDLKPASQGYLALGLMGLAPYWFEVGAFAFLSHDGEPSLRFEADTDLFITQRMVLTVGGELDWLLTEDDTFDQAAGISAVELGVRTRYEFRRKFAPYIDLSWVDEAEPRTVMPGEMGAGHFRLGGGVRLIY
jgi:copper resistance protein B